MMDKEESRYRWMVASRVLLAAVGGYALTSAGAIFMALIWPSDKPFAVLGSTMVGFVLYAIVIIWVFSVASVKRAWLAVIGLTVVLAIIDWLMLRGGAL